MAHFEDCKYFRQGNCAYGLYCGFRHNELSCLTEQVCWRWAAGYVCDGRCDMRHPSAGELAAIASMPPPVHRFSQQQQQQQQQDEHVEKQQQQVQQQQNPNTLENESKAAKSGPSGAAAAAPAPAAAAARVCRYYKQGNCSKGSACPFTHAIEAMGEKRPRPEKGWLGAGESSQKRQLPPPGESVVNASIAEGERIAAPSTQEERGPKGGSSSPGNTPGAVKEEKGAALSSESTSPGASPAPLCRFYLKGRCSKGSSCTFYHATQTVGSSSVGSPTSKRQSANMPLRMAAAQARAAAALRKVEDDAKEGEGESGTAVTNGKKIGVKEGDEVVHKTAPMETIVKAKAAAAQILKKHKLSNIPAVVQGAQLESKAMVAKRPRTETVCPETKISPPKRPRSPEGGDATRETEKEVSGVPTGIMDRPERTKRQRSPEGGGTARETGQRVADAPTESLDTPGRTKRQRSSEGDGAARKTGLEVVDVTTGNTDCSERSSVQRPVGSFASEEKGVGEELRSEGASGQGDVGTLPTLSPKPPSSPLPPTHSGTSRNIPI